jgi:RNA ligase (TIGR02306 family)
VAEARSKKSGELMEEKSTSRLEIVKVQISSHPDPETERLELATVHGYQVVVGKGEFTDGGLAIFVPPDTMVDTNRDEFNWLTPTHRDGLCRVKARRFRGEWSWGLLIPIPDWMTKDGQFVKEGTNVARLLGAFHYEPQMQGAQHSRPKAHQAAPPPEKVPHYDVDALFRYPRAFESGEPVFITEKIHGANGCVMFSEKGLTLWQRIQRFFGDKKVGFHARSRKIWQKDGKGNTWWTAINKYPGLLEAARENPGDVFFFEVFGYVQDLKYGMEKPGEVDLRVFDVMSKSGQYYDPTFASRVLAKRYDFPWVPIIQTEAPFPDSPHDLLEYAVGKSLIRGANHIREGIVVKPIMERHHPNIGRINLKVINPNYLVRSPDTEEIKSGDNDGE